MLFIAAIMVACNSKSKDIRTEEEERTIQRILDSLDRPRGYPEYIADTPGKIGDEFRVDRDTFQIGRRKIIYTKYDLNANSMGEKVRYKNCDPNIIHSFGFNDSTLNIAGKYESRGCQFEIIMLTTPESIEFGYISGEDYHNNRTKKDFLRLLRIFKKHKRISAADSSQTYQPGHWEDENIYKYIKRHYKGLLYVIRENTSDTIAIIRYAPVNCNDSIDSVYYHNLSGIIFYDFL